MTNKTTKKDGQPSNLRVLDFQKESLEDPVKFVLRDSLDFVNQKVKDTPDEGFTNVVVIAWGDKDHRPLVYPHLQKNINPFILPHFIQQVVSSYLNEVSLEAFNIEDHLNELKEENKNHDK
jgi:hypothetical protein